MSLIGLVLFLYSVIVLFEIVTRMLEKHNVIDSTKNETLKKLMDLAGKMTNPVYAKVFTTPVLYNSVIENAFSTESAFSSKPQNNQISA